MVPGGCRTAHLRLESLPSRAARGLPLPPRALNRSARMRGDRKSSVQANECGHPLRDFHHSRRFDNCIHFITIKEARLSIVPPVLAQPVRQPRCELHVPVDCSTKEMFLSNRITNISNGGLFMASETLLPIRAR